MQKQDWPRMNTNGHEWKAKGLFVCIRVHSWPRLFLLEFFSSLLERIVQPRRPLPWILRRLEADPASVRPYRN